MKELCFLNIRNKTHTQTQRKVEDKNDERKREEKKKENQKRRGDSSLYVMYLQLLTLHSYHDLTSFQELLGLSTILLINWNKRI